MLMCYGLQILKINTVRLIMLVANSDDKQELPDSDKGPCVILVSKKWQYCTLKELIKTLVKVNHV